MFDVFRHSELVFTFFANHFSDFSNGVFYPSPRLAPLDYSHITFGEFARMG
jgi:hypothetical protein